MKNRIKISLFSLMMALGLSSCFEEELLTDHVSEGANIAVSGNTTFLFGETEEIVLTIDFLETSKAQIQEVRITKQLITTNGESEVVSLPPVTEGGDLAVTASALFGDVPVLGNVLSPEELSPGDRWVFSFVVVMTDGRELIPRSAREWRITFSCPSDLAGTYTVTNDFCNPTFTATITQVGDNLYELSSADGGFLHQCTSNSTLLNAGTIEVVCGTILPTANLDYGTDAGYGIGDIVGGTWDEATGTLTLTNEDVAFFGVGQWTSTYVRQ